MADGGSNIDVLNSTAQGQLKSIIERVERLEVEKAEVAEQIKEVFAEAKGNGFDVKILRRVVRLRKTDKAKRQEEDAILDLYLAALGELPLFERAAAPSSDAIVTAQDVIDVAHTLYREAVALVLENRNASTSFVQRKLQLPHKTALVLMDLMEAQGVVSPADFKGKRQVLALAP